LIVVDNGIKWEWVMESRIFTGTYRHSVDGKNRLFLPAKLRGSTSRFMITRGLDRCLYVYTRETWKKQIEKLDTVNLADKTEERVFKRIFLSDAAEAEADSQGRIVIPGVLKEIAGIKREAVIIGVGKRLEIWSREGWNAYSRKAREIFERLATKLEI